MVELKTYPTAHDAWLSAMGIDTRWHRRDVESELASSDEEELPVLPEPVCNTKWWLIGDEVLNPDTALLLAGMLWALHLSPEDVVYSVTVNEPNDAVVDMMSGLPVFANIRQIEVSAAQGNGWHAWLNADDSRRMLHLGKPFKDEESHLGLVRAASLSELLQNPTQKYAVWQALRKWV